MDTTNTHEARLLELEVSYNKLDAKEWENHLKLLATRQAAPVRLEEGLSYHTGEEDAEEEMDTCRGWLRRHHHAWSSAARQGSGAVTSGE
ncbi:unnamed protein product [Lampetra planeri]